MSDSGLALISHPLCPFVQRAAIVLLEKGVSFDRIDVDLAAKPEWFLALSPTGKVPLLKVDQADGSDTVLFESMVTCEYLEESRGGQKLYPVDALSRAQQRGWIEFGTAALVDAWQFLNATDRPTADAKLAAFRGRLQRLEAVLAKTQEHKRTQVKHKNTRKHKWTPNKTQVDTQQHKWNNTRTQVERTQVDTHKKMDQSVTRLGRGPSKR